ncbi:MAG: ferritin-like domain-containing protein [Planctomycetota bacterium]|nr:ferritin-like domain-containing protein [Planctomycetota bacterium]
MDRATARAELLRGLQLAHAGELGAIRAYLGHRLAVKRPAERNAITEILKDEIRHRRCVGRMLAEAGAAPDPRAEKKLDRVGRLIACVCRIGGWFIPMYGAARLENDNIVEYEIAARLAWFAGFEAWIPELLEMAEVEWDHEQTLRTLAARHWLWKLAPKWTPPPPRASIREQFDNWTRDPVAVERQRFRLVR